jgi:hypothetical protein
MLRINAKLELGVSGKRLGSFVSERVKDKWAGFLFVIYIFRYH